MGSARILAPISSGDLRHVCDIEQLIEATDAMGTPTRYFQLFAADVRFAFADYRGNEVALNNQIVSQITTYITIRYRPGIIPSMRIKHVADMNTSPATVDYYEITAQPLRDETARRGLLLQCMRRDAAGYRIGRIP